MKNKRFISAIMAVAMIISILAMPATAVWNWRQDKAHTLADGARELNYGENSSPVKVMQDVWWFEGGDTSVSQSYYYSARTHMYYDIYGNTYSAPPFSNSNGYNTSGYTGNYRIENGNFVISYGGYEWRMETTGSNTSWWRYANGSYGSKVYAQSYENSQLWSLYNQYFPNGSSGYYANQSGTGNYRIENGDFIISYNGYEWHLATTGSSTSWWRYQNGTYGNKVYATSYENSQLWSLYNQYFPNGSSGYYANQTGSTGNMPYNYNMFSGYNWSSSLLSPNWTDNWLDGQCKTLVNLVYEDAKGLPSQRDQASLMQVAVNIANGGDVSLAASAFPRANWSAPTNDQFNRSLLALARDVMLRNLAKRNGIANPYIVIPDDVTRYSITGTKLTLKYENGNVYNGNLPSPYQS